MNYEAGKLATDDVLAIDGPGGGRSRRVRVAIVAGAIVLLALLAFWFFGSGAKEAAPQPDQDKQVPAVTVSVPGRVPVAHVISATGSLAARVDMPVGVVGEGGMVRQVLVQPGDWVKAGQVLAVIDRAVQVETQAAQAASVRVAQSDADLAQSELDRAKALVDRGFISKADLDRKTAARDAALARVRVAQAQLAETRARNGRLDIRAPAAGLVLTRNVEPGQVVGAGAGVLFRIAKDGEMEMRAALGEGDMASVSVGDNAEVIPVGTDQRLAGRIWQLSPVVDPQTRQGVARIALSYSKFVKPGGFASADISSGQTTAPLLPQSAIQSDDKGNFVYVVDSENKVVRRGIKVGQVTDDGVAIADGLTGKERIVTSAGAFINPGQKVKPVSQGKRG